MAFGAVAAHTLGYLKTTDAAIKERPTDASPERIKEMVASKLTKPIFNVLQLTQELADMAIWMGKQGLSV